MKSWRLIVAGACAAGISGLASAQLTLDDFAGNNFRITVPDPEDVNFPVSESLSVPGILANGFGDSRDFTVSADLVDNAVGTADLSILGLGGFLDFATSGGSAPGSASFSVDYLAESSVDITAGGNDAFSILILFSDGDVDFSVTLSDGQTSGTGSVSVGEVEIGSPVELLIDLNTDDFEGVDLQSITSVSFSGTNGSRAADVIIDRIGFDVVPEPSSLALLGLGGLLIARRRRN